MFALMDGLIVAPCSHAAARHAVMRWHYSQAMPIGKLVTIGAWENDKYIGAVIFGRGASPALVAPYDLTQTEGCELVRVALTTHTAPVTAIVARAIRVLKATNPGLRLIVSFADPSQNHHGGIYQAGNWIFTGKTSASAEVYFEGKWFHTRMLRATGWGTIPKIAKLDLEVQDALPRRTRPGKYRYLMPLDKQVRRRVLPLAKQPPRG
jgi:hypothetical protein